MLIGTRKSGKLITAAALIKQTPKHPQVSFRHARAYLRQYHVSKHRHREKKRNKSIRMQLLEGFAHECTTTNSNGGGASSIHVPSPCLYKQVESGLQRTEKNIRRQAAATPCQARTSGQQTEASVTRPFASAKQHPRKDNGCRIRRRLPPHEHPSCETNVLA
jgi:hypothetical protein